ncbi:MAG: hypothetical protein K6C34_02445 [Alphaproteobacteria bacterium]|nr:hypothetical protein [Alphaproteobacteria bacterium]
MKTARGFEVKHFKDTYDLDCSIQESSSAEEEKIWLGVHNAPIKIMVKDIDAFRACNIIPEGANAHSWCTVELPEEALVESRMHLNQEQAQWLIDELQYFVDNGYLKEEKAEE